MITNNVFISLPSPRLSTYFGLRLCVILFTSLSLFCSVITIITFLYLCYDNYQRALRLTLQFVILSTFANIVVEVFDVVNWTIIGNSEYCGSTSVVIMIFNAISVSALGCIGLNLVVIIYCGMGVQKKLVPFYYPCILLLALFAGAAPIYQVSRWNTLNTLPFKNERSCWYYSRHFEGTEKVGLHWLWYFCVLFLIISFSAAFGIMAMWKLYQEYHAKKHMNQDTNTRSTSVFLKVGTRCSLYSLVPFIVNFWSFIIQFVELEPGRHSYPISFIDAILSSSAGLLVTAIFFSEPTVTSFLSEKYHRKPSLTHNPASIYSVQGQPISTALSTLSQYSPAPHPARSSTTTTLTMPTDIATEATTFVDRKAAERLCNNASTPPRNLISSCLSKRKGDDDDSFGDDYDDHFNGNESDNSDLGVREKSWHKGPHQQR